MPEPYWPKRKGTYTLSDAHRNRSVIKVSCPFDKTVRYFLPEDLRKAYGDIEVDDVEHQFKCSKCGGGVDIRTESLSAEMLQKVTFRRLIRVDYIRRPIWRDGPAD